MFSATAAAAPEAFSSGHGDVVAAPPPCPPAADSSSFSSSSFAASVVVVDDSTARHCPLSGSVELEPEEKEEKERREAEQGVMVLPNSYGGPSSGSATCSRNRPLGFDTVSQDSSLPSPSAASTASLWGKTLPSHEDFPIVVVGYAFSEKKMSTMGVVMAEASRTKLPWPTTTHGETPGSGAPEPSLDRDRVEASAVTGRCVSMSSVASNASSLQSYPTRGDDRFPMPDPILAQQHQGANAGTGPSLTRRMGSANTHDRVVFSLQSGGYQTFSGACRQPHAATGHSTTTNTATPANTLTTPLHHVVRCFRSSCSSIHDDTDMRDDDSAFDGDTDSANSTYSITSTHGYGGWAGRFTNGAGAASSSGGWRRRSSGSSSRSTSTTIYHRSSSALSTSPMVPARRIAFVPIDLDQPIEEQHGGRMDIILHKLTEDILCLSQLPGGIPQAADTTNLTPSEWSALQRVRNLQDFSIKTGCCLLDHPDRVRTVMRRDTISSVLEGCLQEAASRSGVRVSTPKWTVVESSWSYDHIEQTIAAAGLTYPLIVKPMIAAGMSASHAMAVVSNPTGLVMFVSTDDRHDHASGDEAPCSSGSKFLCQEYSNHDEALYKVYVLGSHVSVHKRRSLPNLPPCDGLGDDAAQARLRDVVEFDSQRPYPRLSDFLELDSVAHDVSGQMDLGLGDQEASQRLYRKKRPRHERDVSPVASSVEAQGPSCHTTDGQQRTEVTVEEVAPVVGAIRRAFGLDLFGFDVLVAAPSSPVEAARWLVVDVNYFPSYKEVSSFPSLLAKYLTERALQDRSHGKRATSHIDSDSIR